MRSLFVAVLWFGLCPLILVNPFVGVLLYSWFSFMNPHRQVWGFAESIPWAMIFALLTIVAWLISKEPKRFATNATGKLLLALMAVCTISTIFSLDFGLSFEKWDLTMRGFFFVLVAMALTTTRARVHALIWVMALSIGFYGIKGGGSTLASGGGARVYGPENSIIGDNNHIAVALLVTLPLLNYLRMTSASRLLRWGLLGAMGLTLVAALASYSRGAFLAVLAMMVFICLKSRAKVTTALIGIIGLAAVLAFMPQQWYERIDSIGSYEQDASATGRLDIWRAATHIALARPLTGGGFKTPYKQWIIDRYAPGVYARAVHSIYFELIGECGFVAFAIWVSIIWIGWRNGSWIIRNTKDSPDLLWAGDLARMVQVSMISYLVGGAFLSLSYWDFFFMLLGTLAMTREIVSEHLRRSGEASGQPAIASSRIAWAPSPAQGPAI